MLGKFLVRIPLVISRVSKAQNAKNEIARISEIWNMWYQKADEVGKQSSAKFASIRYTHRPIGGSPVTTYFAIRFEEYCVFLTSWEVLSVPTSTRAFVQTNSASAT